jgi:hypothetical protein
LLGTCDLYVMLKTILVGTALDFQASTTHASRLNIAEIELSVLARQGLAHNIATIEDLAGQALA